MIKRSLGILAVCSLLVATVPAAAHPAATFPARSEINDRHIRTGVNEYDGSTKHRALIAAEAMNDDGATQGRFRQYPL